MQQFLTILKFDYLQRTRSYAFLITLCASLAIAYTFVPEPNANYSTIRIADYIGYYNAAWFGYVTAIMTSVFLALIGFYLVNSGIKTDGKTKIGQIIAATSVSNFKYLLYKTVSNFLLLFTIVCTVFLMSTILFFIYNDGYSFELIQFVKPYFLITLPGLFFISALAVLFEVLFGKYSVIQNIGFFFLFSVFLVFSPKNETQFALDVFGDKIVMRQMEETVQEILQTDEEISLNIGYVIGSKTEVKRFEFKGIDFPVSFVISRFLWILLSVLLLGLTTSFFHRFDRKTRITLKKPSLEKVTSISNKGISLSSLALPQINYSIFPLLKTELILLFRKGKKWLWLVNLLGIVLLVALPIKISHQMVLPILWFLQVGRISDITTKESTNNVHSFAFTSFQPLGRLLTSQLLAGFILLLLLSTPLIIRLTILGDFTSILPIILGSLFLIVWAATSGILSKGKKLFEVLFFMVTYANINGIPLADYFGGFEHQQMYVVQLVISVILLGSIAYTVRKYQLQK